MMYLWSVLLDPSSNNRIGRSVANKYFWSNVINGTITISNCARNEGISPNIYTKPGFLILFLWWLKRKTFCILTITKINGKFIGDSITKGIADKFCSLYSISYAIGDMVESHLILLWSPNWFNTATCTPSLVILAGVKSLLHQINYFWSAIVNGAIFDHNGIPHIKRTHLVLHISPF